jgi:hypothetical protein
MTPAPEPQPQPQPQQEGQRQPCRCANHGECNGECLRPARRDD